MYSNNKLEKGILIPPSLTPGYAFIRILAPGGPGVRETVVGWLDQTIYIQIKVSNI